MSENLANLRNFKIQLKQVETAMINDAENEELIALKQDLLDAIQLTMQFMSRDELAMLESMENNDGPIRHNFSTGDWVLAPWSEDGQFYEAQVEDITSDGQCTVLFHHTKKKISEVCLVGLLKPLNSNNKKRNVQKSSIEGSPVSGSSSMPSSSSSTTTKPPSSYIVKKPKLGIDSHTSTSAGNSIKKQQDAREVQRRKQQKRKEKLQLLEEEREKDKMKWQSFATKVSNKKLKGVQKKSIFASPDTVSGRVGVGTCGLGGRPMTEYQQQKLDNLPRKPSSTLPKLSLDN